MAEWQSANLAAVIPDSFSVMLDTASGVTQSVSATLGTIKAVIEATETFMVSIPGFDFASALAFALEQFKTNFLATGFYACNMWDYPLRQYYKYGSGGSAFDASFVQDLINSLDDDRDPNRPPFTADCAMLVLVAGAPGIAGINTAVKGISGAFSWWRELKAVSDELNKQEADASVADVIEAIRVGDLKYYTNPSKQTQVMIDMKTARRNMRDYITSEVLEDRIRAYIPTRVSRLKDIYSFIDNVNAEVQSISYPSWQEMSLRTLFPPLVDVVDQAFQPLIDSLKSGRDIVDTLQAFIEIMSQKIAAIDRFVTQVDTYISQLDGLLSATGLYALWLTSSTGRTGLIEGLRQAEDPPFDDLDFGFYTGIALLGGGPTLTPFRAMFAPFGS